MEMQISLTVDGKRYRGTYRHYSGSLPELDIAGGHWRGSSLGPANYTCKPSQEDREYWRALVHDHLAK
jgi:hypothetical protein